MKFHSTYISLHTQPMRHLYDCVHTIFSDRRDVSFGRLGIVSHMSVFYQGAACDKLKHKAASCPYYFSTMLYPWLKFRFYFLCNKVYSRYGLSACIVPDYSASAVGNFLRCALDVLCNRHGFRFFFYPVDRRYALYFTSGFIYANPN